MPKAQRFPGRSICYVWSFLALCISGCLAPAEKPPQASSIRVLQGDANRFEELSREIGQVLPGGESGAAIGFIDQGQVSLIVVGNGKLTEHTLFEFGSITKVVTTNLVAQLALEGTLDLDDCINRFLPEGVAGPQWETVTIRHLATHSAGLSGWPPNLGPVRIVLRGRLTDPFGDYGEAELIEGMQRTSKPVVGRRWIYSNYGFAILGEVLEAVSGRSYESLVVERILEPFGMEAATIQGWSGTEIAPPRTRRDRAATFWNFDAFAPAGALRGSLLAGVRLLQSSMDACDGADLIARANCLAQEAAGFSMNETSEMGLGWVRTSREGGTAIWHNGGTGGFSTFLGFNPATEQGVVILTNVEGLREIDGIALERLVGR